MNFAALGNQLPDNSVVWNGFGNPTTINLNNLTGDTITPESPVLEAMAKLMQGLYQLQQETNAVRATQKKPAIDIVERKVEVSANGNPLYIYSLNVEINAVAALNNVVPVDEEA